MRGLVISSILVALLEATSMQTHTSYQGYTGIINIPTADVEKYGDLELSYTKQVAYLKRLKNNREYKANDHFFNIGILPYVEIGGRLADIVDEERNQYVIRDLSANIKVQIPTFNLFPAFMPKIAIGYQDFGGVTGTFEAKYIVATKKIEDLKITLGYGFGSERLDGFFYGAEYRLSDYLYLLADDDTKYKSVGVLLDSADLFDGFKISAMLTKRVNSDYDYGNDFNFGINFKYSLYNDILDNFREEKIKKATSIKDIAQVLDEYGFENVVVGERGDTLYIEFENHVLEANELKAYKKILSSLPQVQYKKIALINKKSNIKLSQLLIDAQSQKLLDFSYDVDSFKELYKGENSSVLKTRVELFPGLKTFVGTEVGVFDYELSLKSHFNWNLAKGLNFGVLYNLPIAHSDNFDEGKVFRRYYEEADLESAMLHYTFKYKNFFNTTHLGLYKYDYIGVLNESNLLFGNSNIGLKVGLFKNRDDSNEEKKKIALVSYSYYIDTIDSIVKIQGGKYFYQDKGFDITFKKFFNNNAVYLKYQQNKSNKYVGIGFEIPLDFSFNSKKAQIKGVNNFKHYVRTTVDRDDNTNQVVPSGLKEIDTRFDNESEYLNRGRFSKSYFNKFF
jgi:hypothetical protein